MTTKEYIQKYKLNSPNVDSNKFNRDKFLQDLGGEFVEKLQAALDMATRGRYTLGFPAFQSIVKSMQDKFNSISNKKSGLPLTQDLFNAFFAIYVIPTRARLFPEKHQEITEQREQKAMGPQNGHLGINPFYWGA